MCSVGWQYVQSFSTAIGQTERIGKTIWHSACKQACVRAINAPKRTVPLNVVVDTGGGEQATRRAPVFITRPPTTKALRPLFRQMNIPREPCAGGFCANGGTCTMFTGRAVCLWVILTLYYRNFTASYKSSYYYHYRGNTKAASQPPKLRTVRLAYDDYKVKTVQLWRVKKKELNLKRSAWHLVNNLALLKLSKCDFDCSASRYILIENDNDAGISVFSRV